MSKKGDNRKPKAPSDDSNPITGFDDTQAISDFVSRYDEMSRRRLENMNQKLRELEVHMESLETEMRKASEASMLADYCSDHRAVTSQAGPPPSAPPPPRHGHRREGVIYH